MPCSRIFSTQVSLIAGRFFTLSYRGSPFTILVAIKSIHSSWEEVKISTLREVWKKLIPALMVDFGASVEEVTPDMVEIARN